MPKAIVIEQTGGPEVMRYTDGHRSRSGTW